MSDWIDKSWISKDPVIVSQVFLVSVLPYSREGSQWQACGVCAVFWILNDTSTPTGTSVHVRMASVSSVKSNTDVNLAIVGEWNLSLAAFPPWWVLMEGCEDACTCDFPGSILYSVYLVCCVKLPGVTILPALCRSHMGVLASPLAYLQLGKDS